MNTSVALPDKLFFKIGEVARLTGVKQHVLRYWETEFSTIRPQKSKTNQRLYRRKDVEAIIAVQHLLYDKKFTIEGARRHLRKEGVQTSLPPQDPQVLADAAREEAMSELGDRVVKARAQANDWYDRRLLELKSMAADFIEQISADGDSQK